MKRLEVLFFDGDLDLRSYDLDVLDDCRVLAKNIESGFAFKIMGSDVSEKDFSNCLAEVGTIAFLSDFSNFYIYDTIVNDLLCFNKLETIERKLSERQIYTELSYQGLKKLSEIEEN